MRWASRLAMANAAETSLKRTAVKSGVTSTGSVGSAYRGGRAWCARQRRLSGGRPGAEAARERQGASRGTSSARESRSKRRCEEVQGSRAGRRLCLMRTSPADGGFPAVGSGKERRRTTSGLPSTATTTTITREEGVEGRGDERQEQGTDGDRVSQRRTQGRTSLTQSRARASAAAARGLRSACGDRPARG
jgi:hypothetical protein